MAFNCLWFWDYVLTFKDEVCIPHTQKWRAELSIAYAGELRLEGQEVMGLCLVPLGECTMSLCRLSKTNHPVEQVLAVAVHDMAFCSIVVAGVLNKGVGRHLPIQHLHTELKLIPSTGGCRCDKTALIETLFFSLTTFFAQTTLILRYGVLPNALCPDHALIRIYRVYAVTQKNKMLTAVPGCVSLIQLAFGICLWVRVSETPGKRPI